ncbi:MAG: hypothetical protein Terrestrivirus1_175 [Terrestrivirus sp.]|uniref:Uncharacterized protein n=1 Tax=Terrestrivirus sp. TaxID=2487775 RepID=A0A3G4ZMM8_9VIRU|nr:MAG: hypothetical protein Terrestrivirus1_175 [Terrestrivirus sp.]
MGKTRVCKVCSVLVTSPDKYKKYNGYCHACFQKHLGVVHLSFACSRCGTTGGIIRAGFMNKLFCTDCMNDKGHICVNIHSACLLDHKCCFCSDKRAFQKEGTYDGYIDGVGDVATLNRWSLYCSACDKFFAQMAGGTGEIYVPASERVEDSDNGDFFS